MGKQEAARAKVDEERRERYVAAYEAKQKEDERLRQTRRLTIMQEQTKTLDSQIEKRKALAAELKEEERLNALKLNAEAERQEARIQQRLAERRALCLEQQRDLDMQIVEKKEANKKATCMNEVEISMNRDLLNSIVDNDYGTMKLLS